MSEELSVALRRLQASHDLLAARIERMFRYGVLVDDSDADVSDPTKPRARIQVGVDKNGNPVKGPMLPFATIAGTRNQHSTPSKNQQFLQIAPDGNHEAGLLVPLGHSNAFPSPSTDPKEYVDGAGKTDRRFKDGKHQLKTADKVVHLMTDEGQRFQVEDLSKLVIKIGDQAMKLKMDALEPTQDIKDYS